MIEIKTEWTKENLTDYANFLFYRKNNLVKALVFAFPILLLGLFAACIVIFFAMNIPFCLIMAIAILLFAAACFMFTRFAVNEFVKNVLEGKGETDFDSVLVSEAAVFVCVKGAPIGQMNWDTITGISFNDKAGAIYLSTAENAVLILEYKNIVKGSRQELTETVKDKYDKLSKKAGRNNKRT